MEQQRDPRLWRIAKKRAAFKHDLYSYIFINIALWVIWWVTQGRFGKNTDWPWPLWVLIFWGIAVFFDYLQAYKSGDKESIAEQEYEKLKKKQQG